MPASPGASSPEWDCREEKEEKKKVRAAPSLKRSRKQKGCKAGSRKENGKPWTVEEMRRLTTSVERRTPETEHINWADVAKDVSTRSGKQCREKWKNDLRPDISKDPWTLKEEYALAVAHSKVGNRWAVSGYQVVPVQCLARVGGAVVCIVVCMRKLLVCGGDI